MFYVSVYAGNVQHYSQEVPLIRTAQGIKDKIVYVCKEAASDLSRYSDANLVDFRRKTVDTREAILQSIELTSADKTYYDRKVASCDAVFDDTLQYRLQVRYQTYRKVWQKPEG